MADSAKCVCCRERTRNRVCGDAVCDECEAALLAVPIPRGRVPDIDLRTAEDVETIRGQLAAGWTAKASARPFTLALVPPRAA